jgi:hypothetical protein
MLRNGGAFPRGASIDNCQRRRADEVEICLMVVTGTARPLSNVDVFARRGRKFAVRWGTEKSPGSSFLPGLPRTSFNFSECTDLRDGIK